MTPTLMKNQWINQGVTLTSLGSHCQASNVGNLRASTVSLDRWYYTHTGRKDRGHREGRGERGIVGETGSAGCSVLPR